MAFSIPVRWGLSRYGLIRNVQDRKPAPTVRMSASSRLARSRTAAPERVSAASPSTCAGKHSPRKMTSATDGNAVWCSASRTAAVMLPAPNAKMPRPHSSHGAARRGRLRRTPTTMAAVLVSTNVVSTSGRLAGTATNRTPRTTMQPQ